MKTIQIKTTEDMKKHCPLTVLMFIQVMLNVKEYGSVAVTDNRWYDHDTKKWVNEDVEYIFSSSLQQ